MSRQLRTLMGGAACVMVLTLATGVTVAASVTKPAQSPATGQPGASASPTPHTCQTFIITPGNSAAAQGSVFNSKGTAGNVYAGNPGTASLNNANSTAAVSQYDIACR